MGGAKFSLPRLRIMKGSDNSRVPIIHATPATPSLVVATRGGRRQFLAQQRKKDEVFINFEGICIEKLCFRFHLTSDFRTVHTESAFFFGASPSSGSRHQSWTCQWIGATSTWLVSVWGFQQIYHDVCVFTSGL